MKFSLWATSLLLIFTALAVSIVHGEEKPSVLNACAEALNRLSEFRVEGVYGSQLEDAWHPSAFYKLIHRMRQLRVIEHEFRDRFNRANLMF